MDDKIRQALGQLQAPQQVKDRAYEAVLEKVAPKPKRRPVWQPALAFCALLVFLLGAGGWVYLTPTAYLSVDVNPSLELGINRFGTVVQVDAYNADGETLAQSLQARFREAYDKLSAIHKEMAALRMDEAEKARRIDSLEFQINELERAELKAGEEEALRQRRDLLRNSEKFMSAVQGALWCLSGGDDGGGAVSALREAAAALGPARSITEELGGLHSRLEDLQSEAYDVSETLRDMADAMEFSPQELDNLESRLDQLYRLKKKYGATVEDMLDYLDQCRKELDRITFASDTVERLEKSLAREREQVMKAAALLSDARKAAAKELERRIQDELRQLDMPRVRFSIVFGEKEPDPTGVDVVRFLMSANVGEELRPISKVASGGELARIMLALKNVLAEQEAIGTLVFDEVDTGVSGRAAQKVAEKLAQVSRRKQVLCVTHLPQLAAMADTHFSVEKGERDGRTYTRVTLLDRERRKAELARITGGSSVTAALLASAGELLDAAETYRASL